MHCIFKYSILFLKNFSLLFYSHKELTLITNRVIEEADKDLDGKVSLAEYREVTTSLDLEGKMSFISFS